MVLDALLNDAPAEVCKMTAPCLPVSWLLLALPDAALISVSKSYQRTTGGNSVGIACLLDAFLVRRPHQNQLRWEVHPPSLQVLSELAFGTAKLYFLGGRPTSKVFQPLAGDIEASATPTSNKFRLRSNDVSQIADG
jgi:hypothetical protein